MQKTLSDKTLPVECNFEPPLDPGIADAVRVLRAAGVETFESCEGGQGHSYPEPTVRFHGDRGEGFRALAAMLSRSDTAEATSLKRVYDIIDREPIGPYWEITFKPKQGR
jgi:hypothetical protein